MNKYRTFSLFTRLKGPAWVVWLIGFSPLAVILFLRLAVFEPALIESNSMNPTLEVGDLVIANRWAYLFAEPGRGEIVGFPPPDGIGHTMVKRVIAVPGDRLEALRGELYLNGELQDEPYTREREVGYAIPEVTTPDGALIVLGDNRNESFDSSRWGFLRRKVLRGRVFAIIWPLNRARRL